MQIISPEFEDGENIPSTYTCQGQDISPPLEVSDVPEDAKSLVLIVDDPDAPGQTWVHWLVWNIPADIEVIEEDVVPEGALLGSNDFDRLEYGGPCPPTGTHRYFFKLYALDAMLDLEEGATKEELEDAMEEHVIEEAELIGTFSKP